MAGGRVEVSHPDVGAAIHYTTDDTGPAAETPRYHGAFTAPPGTTVRAAAFRDGFVPSRLSSFEVPR
jgi:hypothetical protein